MIRLKGRVLGIPLFVEETVTQYLPHARKVWETVGEPRLLVISRYRMGFEIEPLGIRSRVRIWIDWARPGQATTRWLSVLLGRFYARWCTGQMLRDCVRQFTPGPSDA